LGIDVQFAREDIDANLFFLGLLDRHAVTLSGEKLLSIRASAPANKRLNPVVVSCQLSVVSCQLSVVSCQLSVVSGCSAQLTTDNGRRPSFRGFARSASPLGRWAGRRRPGRR